MKDFKEHIFVFGALLFAVTVHHTDSYSQNIPKVEVHNNVTANESTTGYTFNHSGSRMFISRPEALMFLGNNGGVTRNRVLTAVLGKRGDIGDGWEEMYRYQNLNKDSQMHQLQADIVDSKLPKKTKLQLLQKVYTGSFIGLNI